MQREGCNNYMKQFITVRGSPKSTLSYFRWIYNAFLTDQITKEDFITMVAAAKVMLLGEDYNETIAWMEEMYKVDYLKMELTQWPT
jgi:hypothetical protein